MSPEKRHVLFLPSWYPNRTYGTHGIFIKRHAQAVAGVLPVTVIYACSDASLASGYETEEKEEGQLREIIVYYAKVKSSIPLVSSAIKLLRFLAAYKKAYRIAVAKYGKAQLVHLNVIFPAGIFALWLHRSEGIPLVITEQWSGYFPADGNYKGFLLKYITRLCVKKSKTVITVSESLRDAMQKHGLENTYYVLPNVVNTDLFKPTQRKDEKGPVKKLLHVSTVNDKEKNISGMLRAIKQVSMQRQDFILDIIGDGPEREKFEKLAAELGLKDSLVFFRGFREPAAVAAMMAEADVYLMFSNYETFSTVIAEALAAGVPVIATATGVMPSLSGKNAGIMVQPGNEAELAQAVLRMLDECGKYDKRQLSDFAKQYFAQEAMGAKFVEIYKQAVSAEW